LGLGHGYGLGKRVADTTKIASPTLEQPLKRFLAFWPKSLGISAAYNRPEAKRVSVLDEGGNGCERNDVPLEVGGNPTDPRNLWPEPLHGPWNAHTKDKLENLMHELVCSHHITLAEGRAAFLGDWIAAHQKYVVRR
jgi:hypothetical protein